MNLQGFRAFVLIHQKRQYRILYHNFIASSVYEIWAIGRSIIKKKQSQMLISLLNNDNWISTDVSECREIIFWFIQLYATFVGTLIFFI